MSVAESHSRSSCTYILKSADSIVYVAGRVFIQLLVVSKDDDSNINGAEDGELVSLLEQAAFALEESTVLPKSARVRVLYAC